MKKKCTNGVLCVETGTILILCLIAGIIGYLIYIRNPTATNATTIIQPTQPQKSNDILLNPYTPPYRNDGYGMIRDRMLVPTATNIGAVDVAYRQIGILTPTNKIVADTQTNQILPLMGRPLLTNRDKWQFYTMTKHNIKLPIKHHGKSGSNEYGCDNIFSGDIIYVDGYEEGFKATVYDNDTMQYI